MFALNAYTYRLFRCCSTGYKMNLSWKSDLIFETKKELLSRQQFKKGRLEHQAVT